MDQPTFIEACLANPERFLAAEERNRTGLAHVPEYRTESGGTYPLCTTPFFMPRAQLERIETMGRELFAALATGVDAIRSRGDYRLFGPQQFFAEVNAAPRRYDEALYSARFDVMLDRDGEPKLLEFNTCCPAGMCFMTAWRRLILSNAPFGDFAGQIGRFAYDDQATFLRGMADIALEKYGRTAPLRFAFVNDDSLITQELPLMVRIVKELGHHAAIHPIRALRYDGEALRDPSGAALDVVYLKCRPIGLKYGWSEDERRAYQGFLTACARDQVAVFNPFSGISIGEDKGMMALLRAGEFDDRLTPTQRENVARHIPPTWLVDESLAERAPSVFAEPARYILKGRSDTRGFYVIFGRNHDQRSWAQTLAERCDGNWLVQEVIEGVTQTLPTTGADGRIEFTTVTQCLGVFVLRGQVTGVVSRISANEVHNVAQGGIVQAVVIDD